MRFDDYRIESSLGQGGMGEVFLAWDERLERHVAIKRVRGDKSLDPKHLARFRREARAVARLNHPAIVQIFDVLDTDDGECIVMEYVEGSSLAQLIAGGEIDLHWTVKLGEEIADGLAEAHAKGLVHRDLKPANVLVTAAGHAKILDFGLVRTLPGEMADVHLGGMPPESGTAAGPLAGEGLTAPGILIGTVHAMSPEQAGGRPVDHRSDLFAFGGLLYEMLTGSAPFRGRNVLETLWRVTNEEPEPLAEKAPGTPHELVALVESLLAKDPAERPRDARCVAGKLERLATLLTGTIQPLASPAPPRPPPEAAQAAPPEGLRTVSDSGSVATSPPRLAIRTLLLTGLVDGVRLMESLGDSLAVEMSARHDRVARDLLVRHDGLEIDKRLGIFALFERPADAVAYALAYHGALAELAEEIGRPLSARVGIHLGEVFLRKNAPADVARGAKPMEVDGLARPIAARLMSLARSRQTLLSHGAFDLARHAGDPAEDAPDELRWLAHGPYLFEGHDEPLEIFEVGFEGFAPLARPADTGAARRLATDRDEATLGWRPAAGQTIPRRPNWTLDARLAANALGEVWRARHPSGEHRVFKFCFEPDQLRALKQEVELFRVLKEALGRRSDIARLLDWDFDQAPFYLEIEYSQEGDLAAWAEARGGLEGVPLETRLELVAQVCDALAAAHSVDVAHKNLHPANVLIRTDAEGRPRALLTDFSFVASRVAEAGAASASATAGPRSLYLAPEILEGGDATDRSDLYAVGVLLYQMVTGDLSRILAPGWRRDVGDELLVEDIARSVDRAPENRPATAFEIADRLRGLEERRRVRRARIESQAARAALARSRRRRRYLALAAGLFLLVAVVMAIQEQRAVREAARANREAETARRVSDFLVRLFEVSDPGESPGQSLTAREILDRGSDAIRFGLTDEPDVRAAVMSTLARVYGSLGVYETAFPMAREALDHLVERHGRADHRVAAALHVLARLHYANGEFGAALEAFRETLELRRRLFGDEHPEVAVSLNDLGLALEATGDLDAAERRLREALTLERRIYGEEHRTVAASLHNLARVLDAGGREDEAEGLLRRALDLQRLLLGELHPEVAASLNNLGVFLYHRGDPDAAEELLRQALDQKRRIFGDAHPEVAAGLNNLAVLAQDRGQDARAEALYGEALEIYRRRFGDDNVHVATALVNLAQLELARGDADGAATRAREARRVFGAVLPAGHWRTAHAGSVLGACLTVLGRFSEAEPLVIEGYEALRKDKASDGGAIRDARARVVRLYDAWGRSEAAARYREAGSTG